jgi:hypothetical protein
VSTRYGIRFIATSGKEGNLAQNLLKRMSDAEKKNTLLVINLDNLVVGDKLILIAAQHPPRSQADPRPRAGYCARKGIAAYTNRDSIMIIRKAPAAVMTPASLIRGDPGPVGGGDQLVIGQERWLSAAEQIASFPHGNQLA